MEFSILKGKLVLREGSHIWGNALNAAKKNYRRLSYYPANFLPFPKRGC
jgi:hypothetical protein